MQWPAPPGVGKKQVPPPAPTPLCISIRLGLPLHHTNSNIRSHTCSLLLRTHLCHYRIIHLRPHLRVMYPCHHLIMMVISRTRISSRTPSEAQGKMRL